MYRYFYETDGQTFLSLQGSIGKAIDAAMMDFSSGKTEPVKIQDFDYADVLDFQALQWLYSRTWGAKCGSKT